MFHISRRIGKLVSVVRVLVRPFPSGLHPVCSTISNARNKGCASSTAEARNRGRCDSRALSISFRQIEGWHRIIAVNQTSVFLGTKLAAEQMAKTGGRSIVNISSIMGFLGSTRGHPAYHALKGAVRIYSKAAAVR